MRVVSTRAEFSVWFRSRIFALYGLNPNRKRLAASIGMAQSTLRGILAGDRDITDDTATKVAVLIDVDATEVKRRAGVQPIIDVDPNDISVPDITRDELVAVHRALSLVTESLTPA